MLVTTISTIPGKEIDRVLGIAEGQVVQSNYVSSDIMANIKNVIGGEIKGYTRMLKHIRTVATNRMIADAESMGADAVVGVIYTSSTVMNTAFEMMAYGTAVKFKKPEKKSDAEKKAK